MPCNATDPSLCPYLIHSIRADLITPVRAFLCLHQPGEDAFLLESVEGSSSQARYSFLGFDPFERFEGEECARLIDESGSRTLPGHPLTALEDWAFSRQSLMEFHLTEEGKLITAPAQAKLPSIGSAVGWADFSAFGLAESALAQDFHRARPARIRFARFRSGLVFDHLRQQAHLYRCPKPGETLEESRAKLLEMAQRLENEPRPCQEASAFSLQHQPDRNRFERNFQRVQQAITAGDSYQIVISEPFEGEFQGEPFQVYRRLRHLNPSPYHFYIALHGRTVVGASPEMLIRVEEGEAMTVPIAGTRKRGATPQEDLALEQDLKQDPKELAEHAMLVDLARNDLGRVCRYGSVHVPALYATERFSHVMHLVSHVKGLLAPDRKALDALWSTFPAGTVSGAPKIRATQILTELEGEDRGVYGGAVGLLGPANELELCIAIRCAEFEALPAKDHHRVRFRAGAGIVADSVEDSEFSEIHHKAGIMLKALSMDEKPKTPATPLA